MARRLAPVVSDMRRAIVRLKRLREESDLIFQPFSDDRAIAERFIEIVSEASRAIPQDVKDGYPALPWRRIADIGNHIRHAYHRVDADLLAGILENDLDALDDALAEMLTDIGFPQGDESLS